MLHAHSLLITLTYGADNTHIQPLDTIGQRTGPLSYNTNLMGRYNFFINLPTIVVYQLAKVVIG